MSLRDRALALAGLLAGWLVYAWPWLSGAVTIPWDAKSQFWPHYYLLARGLATGELPLWLPELFAGTAHLADPQSFLFSPWFLLWAWLDPEPSFRRFDTAVLGLPLLGGAGVLLWSTARGQHPLAALLGGLVFLAGGSAAWRLQHVGQLHSLAVLPWLLFALDRTIARGSWPAALASGLLAAVLLAGRDQVALLGAYLALAFVLARWASGPDRLTTIRRSFGPLVLAAGLAALLAAPPLVLTALEAARSNRVAIDLEGAGRGSLHPALLLTLVTPHLFGSGGPMAEFWGPPSFAWPDTGLFVAQNMGVLYSGLLPLLLLAAAGRALARTPDGPFLLIAFLLLLLYALGWYAPLLALAWEFVPGVRLFRRPADATFLLGLLLALLGARAFDLSLARGVDRAALRRSILLLGAGFGGAVLLALGRGRLGDAAPALGEAVLWFAAAALGLVLFAHTGPARRPALALGLVLLTALDLARNNRPNGATGLPVRGEVDWSVLEPSSPEPLLDRLVELARPGPEEGRRDRVELVGLGYAWPNAPLVRGLEHTLGHNPVRWARYVAAVGAEDTVAVPDQRRFTPAFPSWRSPLADLLGLRWIATPVPIETLDPALALDPLPLVARNDRAFLYENPRALPRVLLATAWAPLEVEAVLAHGRWPAVDLATTVLLEEAPPSAPPPGARPGTLRVASWGRNAIEIEAEAPEGGFLVLHDPWHPWWRATVDARPVPILRANLLFRAVPLPPGRHRVAFTFTPFTGAFVELFAPAVQASAQKRRTPW
ncbi:MAG: YfhO family protein [Geminicoccaceae bacterium]|nr:YfhO family protein [Geminicoccaceae bacterium]